MAFTGLFGTGFEMGGIPLHTGKISVSEQSGGDVSVTSSDQVSGTYCLNIYWNWFHNGWIYFTYGAGRSDISVGVWWKRNGGGNKLHCDFNLGDGKVIRVQGENTVVKAYVDGSLVATGTVTIVEGNWYNTQIQIAFADSGYIKTKVNGQLDIDYAGDTKPGSSAILSSIGFGVDGGWNGESGNARIDNLVIGYGDWSGDIRIEKKTLTGDNDSYHAWRPNGYSLQTIPAAPTVATGAGTGLTGDYHYKVSLVDGNGETPVSVASALVQPSNQNVHLSDIPLGDGNTTARKIYRTAAGGSTYKLVTTIANNVDTTYDDSLGDGSLGADAPTNIHYTAIDEIPASDADYIQSGTNGQQDLHTLSTWTSLNKTPKFVMLWNRAKKDTSDSQQFKQVIKSGATVSAGDAENLTTGFEYIPRILNTDPNTSNPWTSAAVNAAEQGVEAVIP